MDKTKKLLDIINHWSEVEEWVKNYCIITKKKIGPTNYENIFPIEKPDRTYIKLNVDVYDRGHGGKNDCLIISLLSCLSKSYRSYEQTKIKDNIRFEIADFFRRNYLKNFFEIKKEVFLSNEKFKMKIKETNHILYVIDNLIEYNLNELLFSKNFLPDVIIELISDFLNINFFMISDVFGQDSSCSFTCNDSDNTICIYADNSHYRSCKIKNNNINEYIANINCQEGEELTKEQSNNRYCAFEDGDKVKYIGESTTKLIKDKIYTVYGRDYRFNYKEAPQRGCIYIFIGDDSIQNYRPKKYKSLEFTSTSILINEEIKNKRKQFLTIGNNPESENYFIKTKDGKFIQLYKVYITELKRSTGQDLSKNNKSINKNKILNNPTELMKFNYIKTNLKEYFKRFFNKNFNKNFNKSYKLYFSSKIINEKYKKNIYEIILTIFFLIDIKYRENKPLKEKSIKYELNFLSKFENYINMIIMGLLEITDLEKMDLSKISNNIYTNMLQKLLSNLKTNEIINNKKKFNKLYNKIKNNDLMSYNTWGINEKFEKNTINNIKKGRGKILNNRKDFIYDFINDIMNKINNINGFNNKLNFSSNVFKKFADVIIKCLLTKRNMNKIINSIKKREEIIDKISNYIYIYLTLGSGKYINENIENLIGNINNGNVKNMANVN
jgi:hypothetical protein